MHNIVDIKVNVYQQMELCMSFVRLPLNSDSLATQN